MSAPSFPASDLAWCAQHFAMMADGGVWAVPRSGLIFTRRGGGLVLTARMPWTPELAEAAAEGRDVPPDAGALRAYQDEEFELIRGRFEAVGVAVSTAMREER